MRKRTAAIIAGSTLAALIPITSFLTISILATKPKISSAYIYKPDSEESQRIKTEVSKALDDTIGKNGDLNILFDTLVQENQYTAAENAWFLEASSAFQWIDPRLDLTRIPRTNATVERSFYNNNTMMRSFFWSADYHNVGTWVGYNFTDNFAITNLYSSLYQYAVDFKAKPDDPRFQIKAYEVDAAGNFKIDENSGRPIDGENFDVQYQPANWIPNLSKFLYDFKIPDIYKNFYAASPEKVIGIESLDGLAPLNGGVGDVPYFYSWEQLEQIDKAIILGSEVVSESNTRISGRLFLRDLMWNQIGYWADVQTSKPENQQYWVGLVAWVNQQKAAIPYLSDAGPETTTVSLSRQGLHNVSNPNTDINYRDWYVDVPENPDVETKTDYTLWWQTNPYDTLETPFNPSFTRSPNAIYFQSSWNGLLNYRTIGDWNEGVPHGNQLFLQGAKSIDIKDVNGTLIHTVGGKDPNDLATWAVSSEDIAQTANGVRYEFKIPTAENEVFKWFAPGEEDKGNLTAQDYFAGLLAFILSAKWDYNQNGYYTTLFNLDIEKTIEANNHFFSSRPGVGDNLNAKTYQEMNVFKMIENPTSDVFTLIQSSPNVNTLDILTKQYFNPLPALHPGVKYIFENSKTFLTEKDAVNENTPGFSENIYGGIVDNGADINGWWSPGPYILNSSNGETEMGWVKNDLYFSRFPNGFFREENTVDVESITMKYGNYSMQANYEEFVSGQIDVSLIPQANLADAYKSYPESIRTVGTQFLPRSDLHTFNTDIYELDEFGIPIENVFGEKELKSWVTRDYEKAIIADLHLGEGGNSYKIRNGILELVDWYSLASLGSPNNVPYYQNSLVPYGNGSINYSDVTPTFYQASLELGSIGFTSIPYGQYQKNWEEQLK